jgi:hypothetical protein
METGMRNAFVPFLAGALAFAMATPSQATSVSCTYMLLRVYHAELEACHVPLAKDREDRYLRLRASMEKFIRANAKNDPEKMIASVDNNIKRALAGLKSCKSNDFLLARQAMDKLTAPENGKIVNGNLQYPSDPQVGGCG